MNRILLPISIFFTLLLAAGGNSQTTNPPPPNEPVGFPNLRTPTLGGTQFWSDVRYVGGWRIQRNANTKLYRLIDEHDVRCAWGNFAHCDRELDVRVENGTVKRDTGRVVVLLHGLDRAHDSMETMADYLRQQGGYTVINLQYASSCETVDVHAADLRQIIEGLGKQVTEINFVGHSLGNIVVRHYLGDDIRTQRDRDPRMKRMVMLAPPNHGSKMARLLKNSLLFNGIAGKCGAQLGVGWESLEPNLATPDFEFAIIAGGQLTDDDLNNFALHGPDDFTISLEEARLAGAHDILVRPFLHTTIMLQPEVLETTLRFLQEGYLVSAASRRSQ